MSNIIKFNDDRDIVTEQNGEIVRECNDLAEMTEEMLMDIRKEIENTKTLSVPIAELALLGTGVASLIPVLRTVTQTITFNCILRSPAVANAFWNGRFAEHNGRPLLADRPSLIEC